MIGMKSISNVRSVGSLLYRNSSSSSSSLNGVIASFSTFNINSNSSSISLNKYNINNRNNNKSNNNIYKVRTYTSSASTSENINTQSITSTTTTSTSEHFNPNSILTSSFSVPVVNFKSKENVGEIQLLKSIFSVPLRVDILHRIVRWQRAKAMQGTHYAQNMGDIDRTNKKPFSQKGTGRARQGTNHAIQMKGGARAFPPKPRDHSFSLPKKVRRLGLKVALATKLAQNKLVIVENLELESHKTKDLDTLLPEQWGRSLLVDKEISSNLSLAGFNIKRIDLLPERGLNVYSILQKDTLVLTRASLDEIQKRLSEQSEN
ncbi:hypothetical protein PPL_07147 [Heterostelium album PN500]|uniref:Large ribosomal subunit protein uL4m n=1 Tax=Heterostelium pallidum (strain ATCC 26659 / Pp 5 / PN500) TaxID=670386 RepID=D3BEI5_HETP5|nr:hypothetical protein PPL_07147 [Heterostelium album PN500]EFA80316.1 hypothetical protein PPL_07147 [Heterostelium album PN500]|eukprot:XP_020432436.1 hypothetical protein PPL_07147 [Heterostelium album PN500]